MTSCVFNSVTLVVTIFVLSSAANYGGQTEAPRPESAAVTDELKPAELNGKWGYVNSAGQFVIKPKYFAARPFKEGLALVVTQRAWEPLGSEVGEFRLAEITYIDRSGHQIRSPLSARRARDFSEGMAAVVPDTVLRIKGGCAKGGYLNTKGEWAIEPKFDVLGDFSEGLAAVNQGAGCGLGGKWGYISKDGDVVIQFRFVFAGEFHNGRACAAEKNGQFEVIDRSGTVIAGEKCPKGDRFTH